MRFYLDLGDKNLINVDDIVCILDYNNAIEIEEEKNLVLNYKKNASIINLTKDSQARSLVLTSGKDGKVIYKTSFSSKRLKKLQERIM